MTRTTAHVADMASTKTDSTMCSKKVSNKKKQSRSIHLEISEEKNIVEILSSTLSEHECLHYRVLIENSLGKGNDNVAKFFSKIKDSERFRFFKNHPEIFTTENNGYVKLNPQTNNRLKASEENEVVSYFMSVLMASDKMHYLKLVESLERSNLRVKNYFDCWAYTDIFSFFINHPAYFFVDKYEYVFLNFSVNMSSLSVSQTVKKASTLENRRNELCNNADYSDSGHSTNCSGSSSDIGSPHNSADSSLEENVAEFLFSVLSKRESMHYGFLVKKAEESKDSNVAGYFRNFHSSEKLRFFKKHSENFAIGDSGYVSLSESAFERLKEEEKRKEREVISFFVLVLKNTESVHYLKLAKQLECSELYVKDYFDIFSELEIYMFFRDRSSYFTVGQDACVSLNKKLTKSLDVKKALCDDVLQIEIGNSNFEYSDSRPPVTCSDTDLSSPSISNDLENVLEILYSTLLKHKYLHYLALIKKAQEEHNSVTKYFHNFDDPKLFKFFKNHPEHFVIKNDGYVTPIDSVFERIARAREKKVIDYLTSVLRTTQKMHYAKLIEHMRGSDFRLKDYFDSYTDSERLWFFKTHPSCFVLRKDLYVSLPLKAQKSSIIPVIEVLGKTSQTGKIERAPALPVNGKNLTENTSTCDILSVQSSHNSSNTKGFSRNALEFEYIVVETLVSVLMAAGKMDYLSLTDHVLKHKNKSIKKYFQSLTSSEKLSFFKRHPKSFIIENNRVVSLTSAALKKSVIKETGFPFGSTTTNGFSFGAATTSPKTGFAFDASPKSTASVKFDFGGSTSNTAGDVFAFGTALTTDKSSLTFGTPAALSSDFNISPPTASNTGLTFGAPATSVTGFPFSYQPSPGFLKNVPSSTTADSAFKIGTAPTPTTRGFTFGATSTTLQNSVPVFGDITASSGRSAFGMAKPASSGISFCASNTTTPNNTRFDFETTTAISSTGSNFSDLPPTTTTSLFCFGKPPSSMFGSFTTSSASTSGKMFSASATTTTVPSSGTAFGFIAAPISAPIVSSSFSSAGLATTSSAPRMQFDQSITASDYFPASSFLFPSVSQPSTATSSATPQLGPVVSTARRTGLTFGSVITPTSANTSAFAVTTTPGTGNPAEDIEGKYSSIHNYEVKSCLTTSTSVNNTNPHGSNGYKATHGKSVDNEVNIGPMPHTGFLSKLCGNGVDAFTGLSSEPNICFPIDKKGDSTTSIQIQNNKCVLSLSDSHMQSVRYFINILTDIKNIHYQELLHKACSSDSYTSEFFSYFSLEDVLEFIRIHSMYFSIENDGNVILVNSSIDPSDVFISQDHVHTVTRRIEAKAIEFFIKLLQPKQCLTFTELECSLGSAPGYILSFFVANYWSENFSNFFVQHSNLFCVRNDGYIELTPEASNAKLSWAVGWS